MYELLEKHRMRSEDQTFLSFSAVWETEELSDSDCSLVVVENMNMNICLISYWGTIMFQIN